MKRKLELAGNMNSSKKIINVVLGRILNIVCHKIEIINRYNDHVKS